MKSCDLLFKAVDPFLTDYKNDLLVHDKKAIEEYPNSCFLHATRPSGTFIQILYRLEDFSDLDDKWAILDSILKMSAYIAKQGEFALRYYWNGHQLRKIDHYEASQIASDHVMRVKTEMRKLQDERLKNVRY